MKVYVAGRLSEYERVRRVQGVCDAAGWTITFDWTAFEGDGREGQVRESWAGREREARALARIEYLAVIEADLVIWLYHEHSIGAFFEAAWGADGRELWIVGCPRDSIFFYLHDKICRIKDDAALVQEIRARVEQINEKRGPSRP